MSISILWMECWDVNVKHENKLRWDESGVIENTRRIWTKKIGLEKVGTIPIVMTIDSQ